MIVAAAGSRPIPAPPPSRSSAPTRNAAAKAGAWWRENGAATNAARAPKLRDWAKRVDYWRRYRADHPDQTRRDNERRRRAKQTAKRAAKQDTRRRISVGMLRDIRALTPETAAKQDTIHRRVEGIVDFLLWKEGAAKQDAMFPAGASA